MLGYPSMVEAADAVPALLAATGGAMVACEGLDARIVDLVRATGHAVPDLPRGAGWLFVEVRRPRPGARLVEAAGALEHRVVTDAPGGRAVADPRGRRRARGPLPARPAYSGWEDAAVPPEHLGAWLRDFDELLREHDLDGVPYGHFGDGCVHVRIDFPFARRRAAASFRDFLTACALKLREHGGSLSGEHGDGRARSELLPLMYDAESLRLFGAVKAICDPDGLLNPGNLVDPAPLDADLRPAPAAAGDPARHDGRRAPLHRRRQVRRAADGRRDVPVLPRHPGREGLHPRPVAGAAGGPRRDARARAGRPGRARGARPVPGLQGLRLRLPDRRGHGDLQGRGAARRSTTGPTPRVAARAATTCSAGCRAGRGWPRRSRRWRTG